MCKTQRKHFDQSLAIALAVFASSRFQRCCNQYVMAEAVNQIGFRILAAILVCLAGYLFLQN